MNDHRQSGEEILKKYLGHGKTLEVASARPGIGEKTGRRKYRDSGKLPSALRAIKSGLGELMMIPLMMSATRFCLFWRTIKVWRTKTDTFTFNRLTMVGEGAELASLEIEEFPQFLEEFLAASGLNKSLSLKDNFFNLLLNGHGQKLTGGCTGFGCGAAFNFVSVLPDGEVHACRKFPSLLGNIFTQSLNDIYTGKQAEKYRTGSTACLDCKLRPVCRGCPAVAYGFGLDVFSARDPYCFGPVIEK